MLRMGPTEKAWVGGVLSCFGVLTHTHHAMPVIRLQLKSMKHQDMIGHISRLTGVPLKHKKTGDEVNFIGQTFDMLYDLVSEYITPQRNLEVTVLRGEIERIRREYQDQKKYETERAEAPHSTPDSIRHRAEALYHNQDEAVQVVEGFVQAEMATAYDLEQARIARERAEAQMKKGMR